MESSTLILFAGNNNLTTAKINYPLGQGHPQSITFTRMRVIPLIKFLKNPLLNLWAHARSIISNRYSDMIILLTEDHPDSAIFRAEFNRIAKNILPYLGQ